MRVVTCLLMVGLTVPVASGALIVMNARLDGQQQVPPNGSTGSGFGTVFVNTNLFEIDITLTVRNLLGNAVSAGLYGPALPGQSGPLLFPLQGVFGRDFNVGGHFEATPEEIEFILTGRTYFDVFTDWASPMLQNDFAGILEDQAGTSEIRGQVLPAEVPEPGTWGIVFAGLITGALVVRRRHNQVISGFAKGHLADYFKGPAPRKVGN